MDSIKQFWQDPLIRKLIILAIGIAVIWIILRLIKARFITKIKDNDHSYKAKKLNSFIGYFLTVILLLIVFRDRLGDITVTLGIAGAGIAFALQEVIVSFAGWIAIMFGGFYKSGDRVQLGGIKGDVMDIGMLRTTIMETGQWVDGDLYNGRIVLVANSFVFKEPVFNYSGDFPFLWDEIKIPIQFGSNYEKTTSILTSIGNEVAGDLTDKSFEKWKNMQSKFRLEDAQTAPMVSLIANDNWVEYTLRFVVDYKKRRATKTLLFTKILQAIEATNGEIKFASATFHLVEAPEFKVKIEK